MNSWHVCIFTNLAAKAPDLSDAVQNFVPSELEMISGNVSRAFLSISVILVVIVVSNGIPDDYRKTIHSRLNKLRVVNIYSQIMCAAESF